MLLAPARLLRLLSLLQARQAWTGADLAERLEVTERTVRRDMDRLRSLGYPVDSTSGAAGGYRLGAGAALPPLMLDDAEAVAVVLGLRISAAGAVAGIEDASTRALGKLEQVLPARLRRRVAAFRSSVTALTGKGPAVELGSVSLITTACADRMELRFAYTSGTGVASTRTVEPHRLVHTGRHWYLVAWDKDRTDWRTFRVDRLSALAITGARFEARPSPDDDVAAFVSRSMASLVYRFKARVVVHAPIDALRERFSPAAAVLEAIDERRTRMETGASSLDALAFWLGSMGVEFEVEDPPELAEHFRLVAERLVRAGENLRRG